MPRIRFPDGSIQEYPSGTRARDVAEQIGPRLAKAAVAAKIGEQVIDLDRPLPEDGPLDLKILTERDPEALDVLRHSTAHVMARAVMRLFPNTGLAFGPTTSGGYYYDFDLETPIREEDFPRIEAEMRKIVERAEPFVREELPRGEARALCEDLRQTLKVEHIDEGLRDHPTLSFYRQGEFVDLCRGPHIPHAGKIGAFKLLSVAGAYWKGDARNRQLQRLYGTAFFSQKDLDAYLERLEEAKKRDHRVLGRQLGLFAQHALVGPGLILWMPKGAMVRSVLESFIKEELLKRGYQPVYTPHLGRVEMYQKSGHFPYYRDSQFPPLFFHPAGQLVDRWTTLLSEEGETGRGGNAEKGRGAGEKSAFSPDIERQFYETARQLGAAVDAYPFAAAPTEKVAFLERWASEQERYLVKPMNCPHHIHIYKAQLRSYRELPVRLAEFGTVYRYEQSGELTGMTRVRGFTQDDAHQFCMPEQVEQEFRETVALVLDIFRALGLSDYRIRLGLRDPGSDKYVGSDANWEMAERNLRNVLTEMSLPFSAEVGEAAFYGPKADFVVRDVLGREWQLGTVQLDYNLPERFELEYIGSDNRAHRPVMIHRAPLGSMERFMGILIEHFGGALPLWLAPEQMRVLPVSEKFEEYARRTESRLRAAGFRAGGDYRSEKVNAKIRDAQLERIPYMLVVGGREAEADQVSVRDRIDGDLGAMPVEAAIAKFREEVEAKRVRQVVTGGDAGLGDERVRHTY